MAGSQRSFCSSEPNSAIDIIASADWTPMNVATLKSPPLPSRYGESEKGNFALLPERLTQPRTRSATVATSPRQHARLCPEHTCLRGVCVEVSIYTSSYSTRL
jgi:hypothetical protein